MRIVRSSWAAVAAAAVVGVPLQAGPSCDSLTSLALPGMSISPAQPVPPGSFAPPAWRCAFVKYDLRAFCRIVASLTPSHDSDIKVEIFAEGSINGSRIANHFGTAAGGAGTSPQTVFCPESISHRGSSENSPLVRRYSLEICWIRHWC
jgi:feruloyl esterase